MEYRSRSTTRLPTGGGGGYNDSPRSRDDFLDRFDAGRAHRSRSLDLRREQDMEDEFESARNRFGSSAVVPYYERSDRNNYRRPYDYDRDLELGASAGARRWEGREYGPAPGHSSPRGRTGVLLGARSQEWYPKREQPSPGRYRDDRSRQTTGTIVPVGQMSPRSASSRRGQGDLHVNVSAANGKDRRGGGAYGPPPPRKDEPSPRSGVYPPAPQAAAGYPPAPVADARAAPPPRDEYREAGRRYDQEWSAAGGGGGGYARGGHHSYHSSHQRSSGGAAVAESSMVRRSPGFFGAIGGQKSPQTGGWSERPRQHYKVRCCCLTFTWPPWSYEPVQPPQPIYRSPAPNQF